MFELAILIGMLAATYATGKYIEQRHFKSIREREKLLTNKPALTTRTLPKSYTPQSSSLAKGSVVISVDYFKSFVASLQLLIGGELKTYSSLLTRARREAVLRMKESSPEADLYLNTRLETSSISRGQSGAIGSVEVICYATAVRLSNPNSKRP